MNENLLKTIDSIDEIIEESEMSVLYALESEYSKLSMLCEYCEPEVVSYIMEADTSTASTKKESLGKKAWRIFVAVLKKIRDKSVALFNKITNNRFNKNVTGTPAKALRKVKKVPYKKGDFTDFFEIYLGEDGQSGGFKYNAKKAIGLAFGGQFIQNPVLKLFLKNKYFKDDRGIPTGAIIGIPIIYYYAKNSGNVNTMVSDLMALLGQYNTNKSDVSYQNKVDELYNKFNDFMSENMNFINEKELIFTGEDLSNVAKSVQQCMDNLPDITNIPEYDKGFAYDRLMEIYNGFMSFFTTVQMGLNAIYKELKIDMVIPDEYKNSCDITEIDEFIEELLNMRYPEKYIHSLVYQAAKTELKDACKAAKWGQFRGCLIPKNEDVVYKYAICEKGKKDNENEYGIYKLFEDNGLITINYLCKPTTYGSFHNVLAMEKVKFNPRKSNKLPARIVHEIDQELQDKNINIKLGDVHRDNIGFRKDGSPVISDYGTAAADRPEHTVVKILGMEIPM